MKRKNYKCKTPYRGIIITELNNGKFRWFDEHFPSIEDCKKDIDNYYGRKKVTPF